MTAQLQIGSQPPYAQYRANGTLRDFALPFTVFQASDVAVWLDEVRQSSGFAVTVPQPGGSSVTFTTAPPAGTLVTLRRILEIRRQSDFQANSVIRAKPLNDELDYQTALAEQLAEETARAVRRSPFSASAADLTLPEPLAGRALQWNADGSGLENSLATVDALAPTAATGVRYRLNASAPERGVAAKLGETLSVKDFGAKGDGVTDDTAAFQALAEHINADVGGHARYGGWTVFIPPGAYRVAATIQLRPSVNLIGSDATITLSDNAQIILGSVPADGHGVTAHLVENINFADAGDGDDSVDTALLRIPYTTLTTLRRVSFAAANSTTVMTRRYGLYLGEASAWACTLQGVYTIGARIGCRIGKAGDTTNLVVQGSTFVKSTVCGLLVCNPVTATINGNNIENNRGKSALAITSGTNGGSPSVNGVSIFNNYVLTNHGGADNVGIPLRICDFSIPDTTGFDVPGADITGGGPWGNIRVTNNYITGTFQACVYRGGPGRSLVFEDNTVDQNAASERTFELIGGIAVAAAITRNVRNSGGAVTVWDFTSGGCQQYQTVHVKQTGDDALHGRDAANAVAAWSVALGKLARHTDRDSASRVYVESGTIAIAGNASFAGNLSLWIKAGATLQVPGSFVVNGGLNIVVEAGAKIEFTGGANHFTAREIYVGGGGTLQFRNDTATEYAFLIDGTGGFPRQGGTLVLADVALSNPAASANKYLLSARAANVDLTIAGGTYPAAADVRLRAEGGAIRTAAPYTGGWGATVAVSNGKFIHQ